MPASTAVEAEPLYKHKCVLGTLKGAGIGEARDESRDPPESARLLLISFVNGCCLRCDWAYECAGAVFGAGFHMVAGPSAIIIGQPHLRMQTVGTWRTCSLHDFPVWLRAEACDQVRLRVIGWQSQIAVRQAGKASLRMGGVFAAYSAIKCVVDSAGYAASAPFAGGALAVAVPYALSANRQQFLQAYFKETVKGAAGMSSALAVGAAGVSGACVFGVLSTALDTAGVNWV